MDQDRKEAETASWSEEAATVCEPETQPKRSDDKTEKSQSNPQEKEPMTVQQRHVNAARRRERELAELTEKIRTQEKERFEKELQALLVPKNAAATSQESTAEKAEENKAGAVPKREQFDAPDAPHSFGAGEQTEGKEEPGAKIPTEKAEAKQSREPQDMQMQRSQTELEEELDALRREKIALNLSQEMDAVRRLNPAIKDLDALCRMEDFPTFYDFVIRNGLTFEQAYRLTFGDKLQKEAMLKADNSLRKAEQGLAHLGKTESCGRIQSDVPPEQMALFRELCPELSVGQIRAWYQKNERD